MYVDAHAHLNDSAFDRDRDEVVDRAKEIIILDAGLNHESNVKVLELSRKYSNMRACLGFHPEHIITSLDHQVDFELDFIRQNAASIVAISEIGLDYKYPEREKQIDAFKRLLKLAEELNLPVVLHSRRAAGAVLNLLRNYSLKVNLHAFSGNMMEAKNALDQGYYFSVGPNIVYNKYRQELTKLIPLEQMLTETDSPVLGPDPNQRNEPHNIFLALEKIVEIKGVELSELKDRIYRNSTNLFRL